MKQKTFKKLFIALAFVVSLSSCSKDDSTTSGSGTSQDCKKNPYKVGTVSTYATSSGSHTITITGTSTINGKTFLKGESSLGSSFSSYIYMDAAGVVSQYTPQISGSDLPANEMIFYKPGEPVGTTWNYTFQSISAPGVASYKYIHTITDNTATFTLDGITYNNCTKVKTDLQTIIMGTIASTNTTISTWTCGLGVTSTEMNGSPYQTLTKYVY